MRPVLVALALLLAADLHAASSRAEALQRRLMAGALATPLPQTHECVIKSTSCNVSINDVVNSFGCATEDEAAYFNVYRMSVAPNTRVTVKAVASSYRPYIVILADDGLTEVAADIQPAGHEAEVIFDNTSTSPQFYLVTMGPGDDFDTGPFSMTISCAPRNSNACVTNAQTLCLNGARFATSVTWRTANGTTGTGTAVPMSGDTGHFWFFNSANVELVIKVLDGRAINNRFWVFYGALSDVEYTITIRDTQTGATKTYVNPLGKLASVSDVNAF